MTKKPVWIFFLQKAIRTFTIFTKKAINSPQREDNYNELKAYVK